jgi:endonuclease III
MNGHSIGFGALVERLGGDPVRKLEIDLATSAGRSQWLVAACVLSERAPAAVAREAVRRLASAGLLLPHNVAGAGPEAIRAPLGEALHPRAEPLAHRVARVCSRLVERHEGSVDTLAAGCDDLEQLGAALTSLASGLGAGTVLRFLRPLREHWPTAGETPLDPAAHSAAVHLGWLHEGDDLGAATLAARLAEDPDPPRLADLEAALARLGRRSCRKGAPERCLLGEACPAL